MFATTLDPMALAKKAGIFPVPDAPSPMLVWLFVH
jgi:hypothetical protein